MVGSGAVGGILGWDKSYGFKGLEAVLGWD